MFIYTLQDVIGLSLLIVFVVILFVLVAVEKLMFWLERKGLISNKWRTK
jgi:hypothetical protein